jgi:hypothetical protein
MNPRQTAKTKPATPWVIGSVKVGITEPFADAMPLRFAGAYGVNAKPVAIVLLLLAYAEGERSAQLLGDGSH